MQMIGTAPIGIRLAKIEHGPSEQGGTHDHTHHKDMVRWKNRRHGHEGDTRGRSLGTARGGAGTQLLPTLRQAHC